MQFGKKSRSKFKIRVSFQVLLGENVAAKILKCSADGIRVSEKKKSVREEKILIDLFFTSCAQLTSSFRFVFALRAVGALEGPPFEGELALGLGVRKPSESQIAPAAPEVSKFRDLHGDFCEHLTT